MKLTIMGSSHGVPEPNRSCTCFMIETGGSVYFVDMGKDVMTDLATRRISPDAVKGVFITHMHEDHTSGLVHFTGLLSWYYKNSDPLICLPTDTDAFSDIMRAWININLDPARMLRYKRVEEGIVFEDENVKVSAYRTKHCKDSFAYLLECEGKRILFSGDLSRCPTEDFPYPALDLPVDLAFVEAAHFNPENYLKIFENYDTVKQVCINHYSNRYMEYVYKVKREMKMPTFLANDGMEFNL